MRSFVSTILYSVKYVILWKLYHQAQFILFFWYLIEFNWTCSMYWTFAGLHHHCSWMVEHRLWELEDRTVSNLLWVSSSFVRFLLLINPLNYLPFFYAYGTGRWVILSESILYPQNKLFLLFPFQFFTSRIYSVN